MKRCWLFSLISLSLVFAASIRAEEPAAKTEKGLSKIAVGEQAPQFKIKDAAGKTIDLAELTAKGPVLVRLTCGCSGCDKELAYFQELHKAYQDKGLVSLAIFKEPDAKVESYVKEKKLNMLYAVDSDGKSWDVFQTKTMPTNFLIDRGGKVVSIAAGCDPSGLVAKKLSEKVAKVVSANAVDVQQKVDAQKAAEQKK